MDPQDYLKNIKSQFEYYKALGDKTFEQLTDEQLFWHFNDASNSIAVIVNHLHGNMLSRWPNFLTEDGEKSWRQRDAEFEQSITNRKQLNQKWQEGWSCLFGALDSVNASNFDQAIYIRNQKHSITAACNRQLAHYAYHVGQIVYLRRMTKDQAWKSLSIPKGGSKAFNDKKIAKGKHDGHYTDDIK